MKTVVISVMVFLAYATMLVALVCMAYVGWQTYTDGKRWDDPADTYTGLTLFILCCALIGAMLGLLLV